MVVSDAGKLAAILLIIAGCFALVLTSKATLGDVTPFLTLITGYLIGNGAAAVRKNAPSSVLTAPVHGDEMITIHGSYPVERTGNGDEGIGASNP
jgi:hypothetical protein